MILLGLLLRSHVDALGMKALLGAIFILLTTPVGAHAIARGAHRSGVPLWEQSVGDAYLKDRATTESGESDAETETS